MNMSPRLRRFTFTLHLVVSVGWIGAVVAYLSLDVTAMTSEDPNTIRAAYLSMKMITWWTIVPLAFAALVSGLVLSLGTSWGLFRHYWVVFSLVLTVLAITVLMVETQTIDQYAAAAADPTTTDQELRALPGTLLHSIGGLIVLLGVLVLNIYKPRGLTRYGWRKQTKRRGGTGPTGP